MTDTPIHPALTPGRLAVVTGGASGIGLAAAHRFRDLGLSACILDRNLSSIGVEGHDFIGHEIDISDAKAVHALAASLVAEHGPPAVLMNNAGIGGGGNILGDLDAWEAVIGTNLMGMVYGLKAFLPAMLESDQPGLIINTGSKQGITQPPGNTACPPPDPRLHLYGHDRPAHSDPATRRLVVGTGRLFHDGIACPWRLLHSLPRQ